jgi:hypothetical protein
MNTKPILLWPKRRSDIAGHLDRGAEYFSVVDTNCAYELQKLYNIKRTTPIFDPFPRTGKHYSAFRDHVVAVDCAVHIVGVEACREVSRALNDPALARASVDEVLAAVNTVASGKDAAGSALLFSSHLPRSLKIPVDWSVLNWTNAVVLAVLVFVASLIGNALFIDNGMIAAVVTVLVFALSYVCLRINVSSAAR